MRFQRYEEIFVGAIALPLVTALATNIVTEIKTIAPAEYTPAYIKSCCEQAKNIHEFKKILHGCEKPVSHT